MSDPTASPPTQEELEAYLAEIREIPVADLMSQPLGMLSTFAQAKLGRSDARPLIDAMAAIVSAAGEALGPGREQIDQLIAQLQMAQVQIERQGGGTSQSNDESSGGETGGAQGQPAEPQRAPASGAGQTPPSSPPQPGGQKATDKLWIPGRD